MYFLNPRRLLRYMLIGIKSQIYLWDYLIIGIFKKRVLLLNYTGFLQHLGSQATSAALVGLIKKKKIGRILPIPSRYRKLKFKILPQFYNMEQYVNKYLRRNMIMRLLFSAADYVIINGEGTIYEYGSWHSGTTPLELLLQAYIAKKIYKKKVLLINHSISFLNQNNGDFINFVKNIYPKLDKIVVREPRSYHRLNNISISSVTQGADASFLTCAVDSRKRREEMLIDLGLQGRFIALFLRANVSGIPKDKILNLVNLINIKINTMVVIFPATDPELSFLKSFQNKNNLKIINFRYSPEDLINILTEAECVLSGRFHYCIFSALAGTPFIPFKSTSDKIDGLIEQLGYPIETLDFVTTSEDAILNKINYILNNRQKLKYLLEDKLFSLRTLASKNIPSE